MMGLRPRRPLEMDPVAGCDDGMPSSIFGISMANYVVGCLFVWAHEAVGGIGRFPCDDHWWVLHVWVGTDVPSIEGDAVDDYVANVAMSCYLCGN